MPPSSQSGNMEEALLRLEELLETARNQLVQMGAEELNAFSAQWEEAAQEVIEQAAGVSKDDPRHETLRTRLETLIRAMPYVVQDLRRLRKAVSDQMQNETRRTRATGYQDNRRDPRFMNRKA